MPGLISQWEMLSWKVWKGSPPALFLGLIKVSLSEEEMHITDRISKRIAKCVLHTYQKPIFRPKKTYLFSSEHESSISSVVLKDLIHGLLGVEI